MEPEAFKGVTFLISQIAILNRLLSFPPPQKNKLFRIQLLRVLELLFLKASTHFYLKIENRCSSVYSVSCFWACLHTAEFLCDL